MQRGRALYAAAAKRVRSFISLTNYAVSRMGSRLTRKTFYAVEQGAPPSRPLGMAEILACRRELYGEIGQSARKGYVPDAPVISLFANHEAELVERQRMLIEDEHRLRASITRLDAICPAPPPPAGEPPRPPRRRQFHRLDKLLGGGAAGTIN